MSPATTLARVEQRCEKREFEAMKSQEMFRQQQEATLCLQDVLSYGIRLGLPVLSWTVTYGGVLMAEVRSQTPREDFRAWAGHLAVEPEDLSHDGETVLRAISETGLPGRGRHVRIILVARFLDEPAASDAA
ncbi:hypothetical protein OIE71_25610 [Streptomyces sp. NBC_01725]|uniref:hypothetical protein n=1 Tax=Streptomyces sp. NBC_01725 TaxID=2975923 RepID=UPI002E2B2FB5|nr:hypothetical protein [Streptomyces sp. NBC_01725]